MLEKTLESPLNCKDIHPIHPKGDQSWVSVGRTAEDETIKEGGSLVEGRVSA